MLGSGARGVASDVVMGEYSVVLTAAKHFSSLELLKQSAHVKTPICCGGVATVAVPAMPLSAVTVGAAPKKEHERNSGAVTPDALYDTLNDVPGASVGGSGGTATSAGSAPP